MENVTEVIFIWDQVTTKLVCLREGIVTKTGADDANKQDCLSSFHYWSLPSSTVICIGRDL